MVMTNDQSLVIDVKHHTCAWPVLPVAFTKVSYSDYVVKYMSKLCKGKQFRLQFGLGIFSLVLWHVLGAEQRFLRWTMVICIPSLVPTAVFSTQCTIVIFLCSYSTHSKFSSSHFTVVCIWMPKAGEKQYAGRQPLQRDHSPVWWPSSIPGWRSKTNPSRGCCATTPRLCHPKSTHLCAQITGSRSKLKHIWRLVFLHLQWV